MSHRNGNGSAVAKANNGNENTTVQDPNDDP